MIKKYFDPIIHKMGLMRKSSHEDTISMWIKYSKALADAAKDKGVSVLFDNDDMQGETVSCPIFMHGSRINFSGNNVIITERDMAIIVAPNSKNIRISDCNFLEKYKVTP